VLQGAGTWTFINVQYHPEWSKVLELRQDVRIRRGLLTAIDRDALRAVILPGFAETEPDSFMPKSDPRAPAVGKPFARFHYDPAQAQRDLADAGWRKEPNGQIVNAASEPVELPFRATPSGGTAMEIVSQAWRDQGLRVAQEVVPGSLVSDRGYRASFPGLEITAQSSGDAMVRRFDGRKCPQPPRFSGSQGGCYMNPELDRLIDKLYGTVDIQQQGIVLRDIGEFMATNLVTLPIYFSVRLAAVRQGVQTPSGPPGKGLQPALPTRNAHLWERA
jgi:ABC-type transport system substrate-binding protein